MMRVVAKEGVVEKGGGFEEKEEGWTMVDYLHDDLPQLAV